MSKLPKAYEAKNIDTKWYQFWECCHFFTADAHSDKPAYCIVMPPPNITGALHMGHALVNTLQDVLIRWKRMLGFEVLWLVGTDHAGIATQTVVERHLMATQGKKRTDFERSEFLEHVWQWKKVNESRILDQIKRLGCSCDWSRLRFTMDEGNNQAVRVMFKKLYDQNLIYQGDYLVNWDPVTQTALADDEVEHEERHSFLWHIKYPLSDDSGFVIVATTRPETMCGDVAVAVSASDERYAHLIGKQLRLPIFNRLIPIVAHHSVDPLFGTGAVKVTPAHDPNDYQIGLSLQLPMITMMTPDGRVNAQGGEFEGMLMSEARAAIIERLKKENFLEKTEPHINRVGLSYRSKAVIEPRLSKQWFVRMQGFGKNLKAMISDETLTLIPARWKNTYLHWVDNLRDWCISRQLWWGHRIPVWHHKENPDLMICHDGTDIPTEVAINSADWIQETDVLDTWFSSALWPFSALGWPEETPEFAKFYPNSTLITGHDILFFWVARMLAMGQYATLKMPFSICFLHGLIYGKSYWRQDPAKGVAYVTSEERLAYDLGKAVPTDVFSKWEKMSKSKGNIIDPIEMIDTYGTDAVRMTLCASATDAAQIDLDRRRFEDFKNFANKIWNGARFVILHLQSDELQGSGGLQASQFAQGLDTTLLTLEDHWILATMTQVVKDVNGHLELYEFNQATHKAYDFFWREFCAYYLEIVKPILFSKVGTAAERTNKQKILLIILSQSIRLMHPMAPFITEEIFHLLKEFATNECAKQCDVYTQECTMALQKAACCIAPYPQPLANFENKKDALESFNTIQEVIYTIRNIRGEMQIAPAIASDIYVVGDANDVDWQLIERNQTIITALVRTQKIAVQTTEPELHFACMGTCRKLKIYLAMPKELLQQEYSRLVKEQEKLTQVCLKLTAQLANAEFVSRAPSSLVQQQRSQLKNTQEELTAIKNKLDVLKEDRAE